MRKLGPIEKFWLDAVGEPGNRIFYAIVVSGTDVHWFVAEKEQVSTLAQRSLELLEEAGIDLDDDAISHITASTTIGHPGEAEFRIGTMALAIDQESEIARIVLEPVDEGEPFTFDLLPEQLAAAARNGLQAVAAGRPVCPRCRLPEDPLGHDCPAVNGHRF